MPTCPDCGAPLVDARALAAVIQSFEPALAALDRAGVGFCGLRYGIDPPSVTIELVAVDD